MSTTIMIVLIGVLLCGMVAGAEGDRKAHVYRGHPPDICVCDQALRQLVNGDWVIIFMTGGWEEPLKQNYIAICRSTDRGQTWTKAEPVLRFADRGCLLSEAFVHGEKITIFVTTHLGRFEDWRVFTLTSEDNGYTWGEPVPFAPLPRRVFVRNLYISSWGEWFLPYQSYDTVEDPFPGPHDDGSIEKARNGVLISQDEGQTWQKSSETGPIAGWAENNVVETDDKTLIMLIRPRRHRGKGALYRSISTNRGRTWSPPELTDIPNPASKFRLHRLRDGRIVLIHNANSQVRNPLAMWVSNDGMKTWYYKRVLTDFPGALQYPDGFVDEQEGYVHFAFDYNRHDLIYWGARLPE